MSVSYIYQLEIENKRLKEKLDKIEVFLIKCHGNEIWFYSRVKGLFQERCVHKIAEGEINCNEPGCTCICWDSNKH